MRILSRLLCCLGLTVAVVFWSVCLTTIIREIVGPLPAICMAQATLTESNNGQTIYVRTADCIVVKLRVPVSDKGIEGTWVLDSPSNGVLLQSRTTIENAYPGFLYQVFQWRAVNPGLADIRMNYVGSGRYSPPRQLFTLRVLVK